MGCESKSPQERLEEEQVFIFYSIKAVRPVTLLYISQPRECEDSSTGNLIVSVPALGNLCPKDDPGRYDF